MKRVQHYSVVYWKEVSAAALTLKRCGLYRDLRRYILKQCVLRYNDWEIAKLQEELAFRKTYAEFVGCLPSCFSHVPNVVEICPALPFPTGDDVNLKLQRVTLRSNKFLPMKSVWRWLDGA